jgi:hypothetical protein
MSEPFGYWDVFNEVLHKDKAVADKCAEGGNTIIPLYRGELFSHLYRQLGYLAAEISRVNGREVPAIVQEAANATMEP